MKLLMITRKIDATDPLAGFAYRWARKIGENVEKLYVIAWQESQRGELPENIELISLSGSNFKKIKYFLFDKNYKRILSEIDGIFCHMNPEYTVLARLRYFGRIVSWYTHKAINWRRYLMEICASRILTASAESFRKPLFKNKVKVIGHGIDTDWFYNIASAPDFKNLKKNNIGLLSVGRISPTKDYETMIKAVDILVKKGVNNIKLSLVGGVGLKNQQTYFDNLKKMAEVMNLKDQVEFVGPVGHSQIRKYYWENEIFINLSGTGSVDKAVLEAMACGLLVLTSNEAFDRIIPAELLVKQNEPKKLAEKIEWLIGLSFEEISKLRRRLLQEVGNHHNLDNLAKKIIEQFKK